MSAFNLFSDACTGQPGPPARDAPPAAPDGEDLGAQHEPFVPSSAPSSPRPRRPARRDDAHDDDIDLFALDDEFGESAHLVFGMIDDGRHRRQKLFEIEHRARQSMPTS